MPKQAEEQRRELQINELGGIEKIEREIMDIAALPIPPCLTFHEANTIMLYGRVSAFNTAYSLHLTLLIKASFIIKL